MQLFKRKKKDEVSLKVKIKEVEYIIPLSWDTLTIKQFQTLTKIPVTLEMNDYIKLVLCELLNCEPEVVNNIPLQDLRDISSLVSWIQQMPNTPAKTLFKFEGVEYGLIEFKDMSLGEWIDLDNNCKDPNTIIDNFHNIISIIYRPTTTNKHYRLNKRIKNAFKRSYDKYETEPYDAPKAVKTASKMQEKLNLTTVYNSVIFFSSFVKEYMKLTQDCSNLGYKEKKEKMKKLSNKKLKVRINGDGLGSLNFLPKEILQDLKK